VNRLGTPVSGVPLTYVSNLIVSSKIVEEQRTPILGTQLIVVVEGTRQVEQRRGHAIAQKVRAYAAWPGRLATCSRDFR